VSGKAQYTTDVNLPGMLYAATVRCPYAHAKIVSIDTKAAAKSPGCKAVYVIQKPGTEIFWAGDDIVAVAAVDELSAAMAAKEVKVRYRKLPHLVVNSHQNPPAGFSQPMKPETVGDVDSAFQQAAAVVEQTYSMPVIIHSCLEPHGSVVTWKQGSITVYISTQSVSGIVRQLSKALKCAGQQHPGARRLRRRRLRRKARRGPMGIGGRAVVKTGRRSAGPLGDRSAR
jgi:xanthine dehydrogenase YagR molybdenum-binding subunit